MKIVIIGIIDIYWYYWFIIVRWNDISIFSFLVIMFGSKVRNDSKSVL